MTVETLLLGLTLISVAIAFIAARTGRKRLFGEDLDRDSWISWPLVQVAGSFGAALAMKA